MQQSSFSAVINDVFGMNLQTQVLSKYAFFSAMVVHK